MSQPYDDENPDNTNGANEDDEDDTKDVHQHDVDNVDYVNEDHVNNVNEDSFNNTNVVVTTCRGCVESPRYLVWWSPTSIDVGLHTHQVTETPQPAS